MKSPIPNCPLCKGEGTKVIDGQIYDCACVSYFTMELPMGDYLLGRLKEMSKNDKPLAIIS